MNASLWMLCAAVAFSGMAVCARALGEFLPWQAAAVGRSLVPFLFVGGLARAHGIRLVFWRPLSLWVRSLAGSTSLLLTFFAFHQLPVADVLTLTNLFPLWVAVLSWPVAGRPPGLAVWGAIFVGLLGVFLIQRPHFHDANLGIPAALAASGCSAVAMLGLNRLRGVDSRAIVFHFSMVSLMFATASVGFVDRGARWVWSRESFFLLAGLGGFATVGQFCLTKAFTTGAAARVSVVGLSQVGIGVLCDIGIWNRRFDAWSLLGIACVVAPTAWLMLQRDEFRAPEPAA